MRWLCLLAMAVMVVSGAQAARPVKQLYVFGDSYSDIGRGYIDGNGPTAVWYLARRLRLEMVPSNARDVRGKSLNFAVSGATTGEDKGWQLEGAFLGFGMKNQVAEFVGMVRSGAVKFNPATTVFFIAGGLNDGIMKTSETVANLEEIMQTLYGVGARRFRVAILPEGIAAFRPVTVRLNPALAAIPAEMRPKLPGADVATSGWGAFYDEVLRNPIQYGITNTTDACAGRAIHHEDTTPCASPQTHFFYHAVHPSTAAHKVVGDMLYDEITANH